MPPGADEGETREDLRQEITLVSTTTKRSGRPPRPEPSPGQDRGLSSLFPQALLMVVLTLHRDEPLSTDEIAQLPEGPTVRIDPVPAG